MNKAKFFLSLPTLLSPKGRISRLQYFVYGLIYVAVFIAVFIALGFSGILNLDPGIKTGTQAISSDISYVLWNSALLYALFCLQAKRLHDLGWPATYALLLMFDVPVDVLSYVLSNHMVLPDSVTQLVKYVDMAGKVATYGLGLLLTFRAGMRGQNKYGPDPLKPIQTNIDVF